MARRAWSRVANTVRWTSSFFNAPKNDSAIALSQHTPVRPAEGRRSCRLSRIRNSPDVYWVPRSELNRFRFNSDYAELWVKPRDRGLACAGGVALTDSWLNDG